MKADTLVMGWQAANVADAEARERMQAPIRAGQDAILKAIRLITCTNANPGTYGHECGRPRAWIGVQPGGFRQGFCDRCKAEGYEARTVTHWEAA